MTDEAWLITTDSRSMLLDLHGKCSERKMRLFVCACTRLLWEHYPAGVVSEAIEIGVKAADGLVSDSECRQYLSQLHQLHIEYRAATDRNWFSDLTEEGLAAWSGAILSCAHWLGLSRVPDISNFSRLTAATGSKQPDLLRDIFGNPFRPVVLDSGWRTPDVITLAGHVYHDRAFHCMRELADSLARAGCDNEDILTHCRKDVQHVRGCWVIDLILAKD